MLVYLIRHGDPDYVHDCLTPIGREQAAAVAERMAKVRPDLIFTSPLGRARETASYTCRKLGMEAKVLDVFSEALTYDRFHCDMPDGSTGWAMNQREAMLGTDAVYEERDPFVHGLYANDEAARAGYAAMCRDLDAFFASLGYEREGVGNGYRAVAPNDLKVAVFCHEGAMMHSLAHILNLPLHIWTATATVTFTGITVLELSGDKRAFPRLLTLSDMSHLYKAGLAMRYSREFEI